MTEYDDRLTEADFPSLIDITEEALASLTEDQVANVEGDKGPQVTRAQAILLALKPRVEAADPLLVSDQALANTRDPLVALSNGFRNFAADGNLEHLNGVRGWTDQLAGAIGLWPSPPELPSSDIGEITRRFRQSAGQHLRGLNSEFEQAKGGIDAFRAEVEQRTSEWNEQKVGLEAQLNELNGTIEQQRGRLDEAIERYQGQFSEAQDRRSEQFQKELSELQDWTSGKKKEIDQRFDSAAESAQQKVADLVEEMEAELVKAQGITGFIGSTGTSAGFKEEADDQRKTANILRVIAILFGLAAAGLAVWAIVHAEGSDNPSLTVVLAKTVGSLVFVGIAGYIATQSGHHRLARSRHAAETRFVALPPFIATLPEDQKEDITREAATTLFVSPPTAPDGKQEAALTEESISLVGLLLDAIRRS